MKAIKYNFLSVSLIREILVDENYLTKLVWPDTEKRQQVCYILFSSATEFNAFMQTLNTTLFIDLNQYNVKRSLKEV